MSRLFENVGLWKPNKTQLRFEFSHKLFIFDHRITLWMNRFSFGKTYFPSSSHHLTTGTSFSSFSCLFLLHPLSSDSQTALPHLEFENALPRAGYQLMKWNLNYHCLICKSTIYLWIRKSQSETFLPKPNHRLLPFTCYPTRGLSMYSLTNVSNLHPCLLEVVIFHCIHII